jgi:hypothetical protein
MIGVGFIRSVVASRIGHVSVMTIITTAGLLGRVRPKIALDNVCVTVQVVPRLATGNLTMSVKPPAVRRRPPWRRRGNTADSMMNLKNESD